MAEPQALPFDAPIAGMSLTAEPGNRPWQQPPQHDTVEQAIEYYLPKLSDEEFYEQLLNVMEMGIPITTIANGIQLNGVMTGIHTIDVGILIMPVLVETMAYMADEAGVDYDLGTENRVDSDLVSESQLSLVMKKIKDKQGIESEMPVQEEMAPEPVEEPVESGGLMSRRM
jgi:hypothetical protein|tara:strand:+ start:253 stop:765 length:513 start_codon:yes stop_codon:yes gene_type:complete